MLSGALKTGKNNDHHHIRSEIENLGKKSLTNSQQLHPTTASFETVNAPSPPNACGVAISTGRISSTQMEMREYDI